MSSGIRGNGPCRSPWRDYSLRQVANLISQDGFEQRWNGQLWSLLRHAGAGPWQTALDLVQRLFEVCNQIIGIL